MTEPTEAEVEAAAKIIDPSAWSDLAKETWRPGHVEYRQREAHKTARRALTAAAQVRERAGSALPDIEIVSAKVHDAWMDSKRKQGVTSRKSEAGEDLMVPYDQLSDAAKDLDRGTVKAVYAAIEATAEPKV